MTRRRSATKSAAQSKGEERTSTPRELLHMVEMDLDAQAIEETINAWAREGYTDAGWDYLGGSDGEPWQTARRVLVWAWRTE